MQDIRPSCQFFLSHEPLLTSTTKGSDITPGITAKLLYLTLRRLPIKERVCRYEASLQVYEIYSSAPPVPVGFGRELYCTQEFPAAYNRTMTKQLKKTSQTLPRNIPH